MKSSAQRQRLYRDRQDAGTLVCDVAVTVERRAILIARGFLAPCSREDRKALAAAIEAMIDAGV